MVEPKNKVGRPRRAKPQTVLRGDKLDNGQRRRPQILVDLLKVWAANDGGETIASHVPALARRWGVSTGTVWKYHAYYAARFARVKPARARRQKDAPNNTKRADLDDISLVFFDSSTDDYFFKEALACYNDGVGELCMYFSGAALRKCVECDATLLQQIIACAINAKRLPSERIAMHARIHSLVATQKDCALPQRDVFSDFDHNFISAYMSEVVDEHTKRPERNGPKPERLLRLEETLKQLSASFNSRFWRDFVQVRMSRDVDRVNKLRPTTAATDNARSWFVKRM